MGIHQVPPDIAQLLVDLHAGEGFARWHRLPPNSLIPNAACPASRLQTKLQTNCAAPTDTSRHRMGLR
jgi:hypothetical protein